MAMAALIESHQWQLNPLAFVLLFASCFASLFFFPNKTPSSSSSSTPSSSSSNPLASVMEGLHSVFREDAFANYLAGGAAVALFLGSLLGIFSDIIGPRKVCLLFCIFHLLVGIMKCLSSHPSIWITSICLALASSVFFYCFETWMVTEHEKQVHSQDLLNETFWLMTFFELASLIGSQGIANMLVKDLHKGFLLLSTLAALLAMVCFLYSRRAWKGDQQKSSVESYRKSFVGHILKDKGVWLLAWAQTSIYFSMPVFWFLWAPSIVIRMQHLLAKPWVVLLVSSVTWWRRQPNITHGLQYKYILICPRGGTRTGRLVGSMALTILAQPVELTTRRTVFLWIL